jgi:hypothetical protein
MNYSILITSIAIAMTLPGLSQNKEQTNLQHGPGQKPLTAEDFLRNQIDRGSGRQEMTFLITINEKLPSYRFHLIPDANVDVREKGRHHIGRIEISKGSARSIHQIIEVQSYADVSWLTKSFIAEDINFDGYLDIAVLDDHGAKWGSFNYWLFDKRTDRFIVNSLAKELRRLRFNEKRLDEKAKEIVVSNLIAGCAEDKRVYRVAREHLILMRAEEHEAREGSCKVTTKKRTHGRMKVVSTSEQPRRVS